jgi:hypothetical protein
MNKKFLICGDSWGVGAYQYIGNPPTGITPIADSGLDYFLTQRGCQVTNISKGADSNFLQLVALRSKLEETSNYDFVVWVQTETNRDIVDSSEQYPNFDIDNFKKSMSYIKDINYQYIQSIYDKFQIPFIVVGGLSSIDDAISNYTFARLVIPSWLYDITEGKYDLAENMHQDIILKVLTAFPPTNKEFIIQELDKMKAIEDSLETHTNFSNGVHPNAQQFEKLAVRILNELELQSQESLYICE